ncbi:CopD family protein [Luteimonas deserti]|uniref:Protoporphyrinogen IX oxidase n=1 Tax=Luteimonas deserti TaxID=2752306 RepID=A0A7Z0QN64_9GAMM|nr:CopD family protein [Luteimonas deserti]NYZ61214.1 CopD family protein [Luteimonas deserti]
MYFWLKIFHILAMTIWFAGLFFLPRLFVARHGKEIDADPTYWSPVTNMLFFRIMTPAALVTITLGGILIAWNPAGAWLVLKLVVVAGAVLLHLYFGLLLYELGHDRDHHGPTFYRVIGWVPLVMLLLIAGLTGAKPSTLGDLPPPPSGPVDAEELVPGLEDGVPPLELPES